MQQARPRGQSIPEVNAAFRACRTAFISTGFFSAVVNILMLTGSIFMLQVYDRVLASGSVPTLIALAAMTMGLYAFYGFLEFIRSRILVRIGRQVEESLRDRVFNAVTFHALKRSPGVGSQPLNDLATIRGFISGQGPFAFLDMPWVPFYVAINFLMHFWLGVASIGAAIAIFILAVLTEVYTRKPIQEATKAQMRASMMTDEGRRNTEALHALGMAGNLRARWSKVQQEALDQHTKGSDVGGVLSSLSRVLRLMIQSGILALGAYLAIYQEISSGMMIAASILMSRALAPVELAVGNWQQFLGCRKALERLNAVLDATPKDVKRMALPRPKGRLDVENLIVQLPGTDKPVLQGLTFTVEPGQGIGVIGPTGAGKSTLARALVGVIAPSRGDVRLDGATLDQRDPDELGQLIGYLPQDVQLFDGTVAQNISRFKENADPQKIIEAAQLANIHDLIQKLPDGYNTQLMEGGARLSAGQRQRVALARAIFGDPVILILDEPNSNLDAEGEAALDRGIRHCLEKGASVVVIAHRPSALASIHQIMVLSDGKVAALGPRDEIMRKVLMKNAGGPQQGQGPQGQGGQVQVMPPQGQGGGQVQAMQQQVARLRQVPTEQQS